MKHYLIFWIVLAMLLALLSGCKSADPEEMAALDTAVSDVTKEDETPDIGDAPVKVDPADEPADDPADEPKDKPADEPQDEPKDEPIDEPKDEPADDPQEEPEEEPIEEPEEEMTVDYSDYITVVSYNVKSFNLGSRTDDIVALLKELDGDIVGLQEISVNNPNYGYMHQVEFLAKKLGYPYYYFCSTSPGGSGSQYGHGILSRYPIKDSQESGFAFHNDQNREYSRHVLDIEGREVIYYNTHLCTGTWEQTGNQFLELMRAAYKETSPTIVTGDFNLSAEELTKRIHTSKLIPLNGGEDRVFTVEGISWDNILISHDFDYYTDEETMTHIKTVLSDASDHNPIYSYIKLK